MPELHKSNREIERELQSDLRWLNKKACKLIDKLVVTQSRIATVKYRLRMMGSYVLPDGRTQ